MTFGVNLHLLNGPGSALLVSDYQKEYVENNTISSRSNTEGREFNSPVDISTMSREYSMFGKQKLLVAKSRANDHHRTSRP